MRKGILGSLAALAAGAGAAWGQSPASPSQDPPAPAAVAPAVIPAQFSGTMANQLSPGPVIMPPLATGPAGDPQGLGPVGGFGPPPGPMYPNPGPYSAPSFQPGPPSPGNGGAYGAAPHTWTTVDYLLMFSKGQQSSFPLLTTSAPSDMGLLGRPSTLVLAGGNDISYNPISGFRIASGFFGDADRRWGFEGSATVLEKKTNLSSFVSSPTGIPTLARPFIDSANVNQFTTLLAANPMYGQGRVNVGTSSEIWWAEGNGIVNLYRSQPGGKCVCSIDFLAGYRYLQLTEDLQISSHTILNQAPTVNPVFAVGPFGVVRQVGSTSVPAQVPFGGLTISPPAAVVVRDSFKVTNRFNGGQVGLRGEVRCGMFTFNSTAKLAFGDMNQRLEIQGTSGYSDITRPLGTSAAPIPNTGGSYGGLYANSSNIGRYSHDEFAIIPEIHINMGLNVTRSLTAFIGYNFLYINQVARPGDQINPIVNSATVPFSPNYGQLGRPTVPGIVFNESDYWLMGVNFGFMVRF